MRDPPLLRVLMVGPDPALPGGIASLSRWLAEAADPSLVLSRVDSVGAGGSRRKLGQAARAAAGLRRRAREARVDVLHLHVADGPSLFRKALLAAARPKALPFVVHAHFANPLDLRREPWRSAARTLLGRAAAVVAVSNAQGEALAGFVRPGRLRVIHNGVPVDRFVPPDDRDRERGDSVTILFVGGDERRKGLDVLLDAAGRLGKGAVRLRVAGLGSLAVGRCPGVDLLGPLPERAMISEMQGCDVFALPSRAEGLSISLLEAMACGRPVVASALPGVEEVVTDGRDGLLVPPGDAVALAGAIERLVRDPGLRASLGTSARATVAASHAVSATLDALVALWSEVAVRRG